MDEQTTVYHKKNGMLSSAKTHRPVLLPWRAQHKPSSAPRDERRPRRLQNRDNPISFNTGFGVYVTERVECHGRRSSRCVSMYLYNLGLRRLAPLVPYCLLLSLPPSSQHTTSGPPANAVRRCCSLLGTSHAACPPAPATAPFRRRRPLYSPPKGDGISRNGRSLHHRVIEEDSLPRWSRLQLPVHQHPEVP